MSIYSRGIKPYEERLRTYQERLSARLSREHKVTPFLSQFRAARQDSYVAPKRSRSPFTGLPYTRLLEDLSSEFGRLSAQVESLTEESEQLRRENLELNELVTCGLQHAASLKDTHAEQATSSLNGTPREEATTADTSARSNTYSARSAAEYSLNPCRASTETAEIIRSQENLNSVIIPPLPAKQVVSLDKKACDLLVRPPPSDCPDLVGPPPPDCPEDDPLEETPLQEMPEPPMISMQVQCRPVHYVNPDTAINADEWGDGSQESESYDVLSEMGAEPKEVVEQERLQKLREQFDRLDKKGLGILTAQDCWAVVSHIENQKYGHVKHEVKRVYKTVKAVIGERGGCRASASVTPDIWASQDDQVGIDFDTFVEFMQEADGDENSRKSINGEDVSYLRKCFLMESTEHLMQAAKHAIAIRQQFNREPQPRGLLKIWLETLPPIIISANALVIGLQNDIPHPAWEYIEKVFLTFYITEFVLKVRLLGLVGYFRGMDGRWNSFDFACLLSGLFDLGLEIYTQIGATVDGGSAALLPLLKVVRLARLARIVRSFRYKIFEDLKSMVSGVFSGARVLWWSIVLLFIVVYTLGVLMRQVIGTNHKEFSNLPSAMFTVFRCFTDGCAAYDGTPLQERLRLDLELQGYGGIFMVAYILMFLVVTVGVFNLIMAIFIDNVVSTTVKRKQQELGAREDEMKVSIEEMLVQLIKASTNTRSTRAAIHSFPTMRTSMSGVTKGEGLQQRAQMAAEGMAFLRSQDVIITRDLFNTWLTDADMLALLDDMEIDIATKFEIFDVCDVDKSGSLTPDELVSGLMRLRGPISKCDIIAVRLKVRYITDMLEDIHNALCC